MFTYSKLVSLLKTTNNTCHKCLKHKSVKKSSSAKEEKKYTNTVLIPKTKFPLWLSGVKRTDQDEKHIQERGFSELYNWQREHVKGPEFVLHDGPPYANGQPHMGHAINKILKDITMRHKLVQGHRIHYKPGWDCHGLPIELKAMAGQDVFNLSTVKIRSEARKFAKEAIRDQKFVFRSWGVMADWENGCYFTFDKSYVKNQLHQFYKLYKQDLVFRDVKPVFWSPSSRTALAEAELEYKPDHESTCVYVCVRVSGAPAAWARVYALVWTTTPWTLSANEAIAFNPTLSYCLVSLEDKDKEDRFIVASSLVEQLETTLKRIVSVEGQIEASQLETLRYHGVLDESRLLPFLPSHHVTAEKGTGLVHIAPAHGPDDFKLGKKFNLHVSCLVDERGCFTLEAGEELCGLSVLTAGTNRVLELCKERDALIHVHTLTHAYPYDWRTNLPVILRASQQWFFNTAYVKEQALAALKGVQVIPEKGQLALESQVKTRPFWCISRQRVWGVPVPVLYTADGTPVISRELVDHYCHLLDEKGDDFWWSCSTEELAPPHLLEKSSVDQKDVERSQDILDIWLDSGLSWSAVLEDTPADLYLEGVDQFNGWFQSSLMTSVALQQKPPYKTVFVHGFAVDENGEKMSKSVGNVVNPQEIIHGGPDLKTHPVYGVDTLRWWVAGHSTGQSNVPVSPRTLSDSKECVQKLRSIFRFILGGLHEMPPATLDTPPTLRYLDRYMLHSLHSLEEQVFDLYNNFQYNRVCSTLTNFVANQVSALYCHLTKDRLYCSAEDSSERRAVQFTLYHSLHSLLKLVAPVLPVLAEEVYSHLPIRGSEWFFHTVSEARPDLRHPEVEATILLALEVKQEVLKLSPLNCNNWELSARISAPKPQWQQLKKLQNEKSSSESELAEILQVSQVTLAPPTEGVHVEVGLVGAPRCERCRRHTAPSAQTLCTRCQQVLAIV